MATHPTQATNAAGGSASTIGSAPSVSGLVASQEKVFTGMRRVELTFTNVVATWTDNGATGAGGGIKVYDFPEGLINIYGCALNITALTAGTAALATGSTLGLFSVGTVGTTTANFTLTSTEANIIASTALGTLTAYAITAAVSAVNTSVVVLDGTATAVDLYVNFGGSDATESTANSTITFTGTMVLVYACVGDK